MSELATGRLPRQSASAEVLARACRRGHYWIGRPVIVASSLKSRSERRPVTGSLRSASNFWIAALVGSSSVPDERS